MTDRYYVEFQVRAGRVGARNPWWYVIDRETNKPVRPSGADSFEIRDGAIAKRFAELMNERDDARV